MSVFSSARSGDRDQAVQLSILAQGARIVGEIECDGIIKIEGRLEGTLRGHEQVLVAPSGVVTGDLTGQEIVIAGRVDGDVTAFGRVELRPAGVVRGDVTAPVVVVLEGAELNGRVTTEKPAAARAVSADQLKRTA